MYHSLYLYNGYQKINTWDDWHLIPTTRPVVELPKKKTNFIDIPGGNSSLDISNVLTNGENTYEDREGEIEFYMSNDYDWDITINKINNFFQHSNNFRCVLEDNYYGNKPYTNTGNERSITPMYVGNMWVENYNSTNDGSHSSINIGYRFEPYWIACNSENLTPLTREEHIEDFIKHNTSSGLLFLRDYLLNILTYQTIGSLFDDFILSMPVAITFMPLAVSNANWESYIIEEAGHRGKIIDEFAIDFTMEPRGNIKSHGLNPCRIKSPMNDIVDSFGSNHTWTEDDYKFLYNMEQIFKTSPQTYGSYYPGLLFTRDDVDPGSSWPYSPTMLVNNIDINTNQQGDYSPDDNSFRHDLYISAYYGGI